MLEFYTGVLGFRVGNTWPDQAATFAILERDDVCVQFYVPETSPAETVGHGTLSFDVDDARAFHSALRGRVAIDWGPEVYWYGRREFAIRDPSGYLLIFSEETDETPTCHDAG
jgi:catechol 2,3-dioxygenase-like lactoylglutathione lyase family enzyme